MNRFLFGVLLLLSVPASAQDAPVPAVQTAPQILETSPQTLLSSDFVRGCVYIGAGTFVIKPGGDEALGTFDYKRETGFYNRLLGADMLRFQGFLVPDELKAKSGQKLLLFARFDGMAKRARIVGFLPWTQSSEARVKELIAQTPRLQFFFASDKKSYSVGEPVTITFEIKNISGAPLSIATDEYAVEFNLNYGGSSHSKSDANARKRARVTTLAPGQSWKDERSYDDLFPVGELGLEWFYDEGDVLKSRRALPSDLFLDLRHGELSVQITPMGAGQKAALKAQLKSPRWDEQLDAAQKMLQSQDASDWRALETFWSHPYEPLRLIAGEAIAKTGRFSPELKTMLYNGTYLRALKLPETTDDFALALLARAAVLDEAIKGGFVLAPIGYEPLYPLNNPRAGDILAARLRSGDSMAGGANNGGILMWMSDARVTLLSASTPLAPELQLKALTWWDKKRASVKNPWTPAQLAREIALARKIGYNNFQVGPYDAPIVHFVDEGRKINFSNAPQDALDKELMALPKEAASDLMRVLKWRGVENPPDSALRFIARSGDPQAFVFLAQITYNRGDADARFEATRLLGELDFARAKTHLEAFFADPIGSDWHHNSRRLGAAVALAAHGEKRAVPVIFAPEHQQRLIFLHNDIGASLQNVTGENFSNWTQWKRWWEREGSKREWK